MHIRDKRTVGEQIKSGVRLAGFFLLSLVLVWVMTASTALLLGKNANPDTWLRLFGAGGLIAVSILMYFTSRYWAKWFAATLAWATLRWALRAPLFASLSGWSILELLALLATLFALSVGPAMRRTPEKVESIGLIGALLSLSFASVLASYTPLFIGIAVLGLARWIGWKKLERRILYSKAAAREQAAR
jgi:hypothetical protein